MHWCPSLNGKTIPIFIISMLFSETFFLPIRAERRGGRGGGDSPPSGVVSFSPARKTISDGPNYCLLNRITVFISKSSVRSIPLSWGEATQVSYVCHFRGVRRRTWPTCAVFVGPGGEFSIRTPLSRGDPARLFRVLCWGHFAPGSG